MIVWTGGDAGLASGRIVPILVGVYGCWVVLAVLAPGYPGSLVAGLVLPTGCRLEMVLVLVVSVMACTCSDFPGSLTLELALPIGCHSECVTVPVLEMLAALLVLLALLEFVYWLG